MKYISGPVNCYYCKNKTTEYYIFSDIHIPMIATCNNHDSVDICKYISNIFEKNPNHSIDVYVENRYYSNGDTLFTITHDDKVISRLYNEFQSCIHGNCKYKNVKFHGIDIRYGVKNNEMVQRTIFSIFEKINAFVESSSSSKIMEKYIKLLDIFEIEYWSIIDFYLNDVNVNVENFKTVQILNDPIFNPPPYQELLFSDSHNKMSSTVYNLNLLSPVLNKKIKEWAIIRFENLYNNFIKYKDQYLENTAENHKKITIIIFEMLFVLFDIYALSEILQKKSDIKIVYVGGSHADHFVEFLEKHLDLNFELYGTPNTNKIIQKLFQCKKKHPIYRDYSLQELLLYSEFHDYIKTCVSEFQCVSFPL